MHTARSGQVGVYSGGWGSKQQHTVERHREGGVRVVPALDPLFIGAAHQGYERAERNGASSSCRVVVQQAATSHNKQQGEGAGLSVTPHVCRAPPRMGHSAS